jgi:hypothetical protein
MKHVIIFIGFAESMSCVPIKKLFPLRIEMYATILLITFTDKKLQQKRTYSISSELRV